MRSSAKVKNVEVTKVAVARFMKVARDIAFALITVENTSAGINHAPGPIPIEKEERYNANPIIPAVAFNCSNRNVADKINTETVMPLMIKGSMGILYECDKELNLNEELFTLQRAYQVMK